MLCSRAWPIRPHRAFLFVTSQLWRDRVGVAKSEFGVYGHDRRLRSHPRRPDAVAFVSYLPLLQGVHWVY